MKNKLTLALTSIAVFFLIDASPLNHIYEELGLPDEYNIEDDFSGLLDTDTDESANTRKGSKSKHKINDFKKFYKLVGARDQGNDNDYNIYLDVDAIAAGAIGEDVKQNRKYRKGSKTRGFHKVHHKDEYKKDKEFYEDKETSGDITKFGKGRIALVGKAGGGLHKKRFHHDRQKGIYGRRDYLDKGSSDKEYDGYSDSGFDESFMNK